jgi:osmoprotectant transport system ATP-binding protein
MIQLQNVTKRYGNATAVNNISFTVEQGETLVLLGTSGCGKTTTMRMVNRLTEPTKGRISVNGTDVLQQSPTLLRRGIGYVLQHTGLFPHYTIAQNIAVVPALLKWSKQKIIDRTNTLLQKLELDPGSILHKYPNELSGGQQQRVGLARALAADPPVLLMDEPFGALDPITRAAIRSQFKQLDELKRKTILMVTHDVQEAFELGDKVCIMNKGEIVQMGTSAELLFRPCDAFTAAFLKDHRFQLELQTTSINQLVCWLPVDEGASYSTNLAADTSVWQALELLAFPAAPQYVMHTSSGNTIVSTSALLKAFEHFKKKMAHG